MTYQITIWKCKPLELPVARSRQFKGLAEARAVLSLLLDLMDWDDSPMIPGTTYTASGGYPIVEFTKS